MVLLGGYCRINGAQRPLAALILNWLGNGHSQAVAQASSPAGCGGVPPRVLISPPVPETRTGTVLEPAAGDGRATRSKARRQIFISGFSVSAFNFCFACARWLP